LNLEPLASYNLMVPGISVEVRYGSSTTSRHQEYLDSSTTPTDSHPIPLYHLTSPHPSPISIAFIRFNLFEAGVRDHHSAGSGNASVPQGRASATQLRLPSHLSAHALSLAIQTLEELFLLEIEAMLSLLPLFLAVLIIVVRCIECHSLYKVRTF